MAQIESMYTPVRLSDTELTVADPAQGIRDHQAVDREGKETGAPQRRRGGKGNKGEQVCN